MPVWLVSWPLCLRLSHSRRSCAPRPPGVPRLALASVDTTTIVFTFAMAALAALACGAVPAFYASAPDFTRLRDSNRSATGRRHWGRDALVVGQTALALVLLIGSGLLVRSFWALRSVDPGYDTKDIFTFQIAPEGPHLPDGLAYARFSLDFMDRLRRLPGVESVGLVENVPLNEGTAAVRFRTERHTGEADTGPLLRWTFSAGDYNKAMGIRVIEGRPFDANDHLQGLPHAVISQSAAKTLWPGESAVGQAVAAAGHDRLVHRDWRGGRRHAGHLPRAAAIHLSTTRWWGRTLATG